MLIDSHCHLHDREFFTEEQATDMLKRAADVGVEKVICIGTSHDDSLAACRFASEHKNVYWTYGVHPENANSSRKLEYGFLRTGVPRARLYGARPPYTSTPSGSSVGRRFGPGSKLSDAQLLQRSAAASGLPQKAYSQFPIGIGEVGLDYHYEGYDREAQIRLFEEMLQLAVDNDLPVSFHVREAFEDFFPVVGNFPKVRGVVHSFTDSKKKLRRILNETGFYVGVNGLATYSTLPLPPLERILLETDAPFLAPVPHRGETNEPAYIANITRWLSNKLEIPFTEVEKITTQNTLDLFCLI